MKRIMNKLLLRFKALILSLILLVSSLLVLNTSSGSVFAADSDNTTVQGSEAEPANPLMQYGDYLIFALILGAFGLGLYVVKEIGPGALNVSFVSFSTGILLIGLSRLFLFMSDQGIYRLEDADLHIWWHLIFYFGLLCFIWGGMRLKQISSSNQPTGFGMNDKLLLGFLTLMSLVIFFIAQPLEQTLSPVLVGSFVDKLGIHHFIAVTLAVIVAFYMYYIKNNWGKMLSVSVTPIMVFLCLMGMQHLWELLTESWKVIPVTTEWGEQVEQFIVIPALIFIIYGFIRVARFVKSQTQATPSAPTVS